SAAPSWPGTPTPTGPSEPPGAGAAPAAALAPPAGCPAPPAPPLISPPPEASSARPTVSDGHALDASPTPHQRSHPPSTPDPVLFVPLEGALSWLDATPGRSTWATAPWRSSAWPPPSPCT